MIQLLTIQAILMIQHLINQTAQYSYKNTLPTHSNLGTLLNAQSTTHIASQIPKSSRTQHYSLLLNFTNIIRTQNKKTIFFTKSPLIMSCLPVFILTLTILSLSPTPTSSIQIQTQFPNPNTPNTTTDLLIGDAHFNKNTNTIQLNQPTPLSFGIIIPTTPFSFSSSTSFSSHLTFEIGNNVALVIIPYKYVNSMSVDVFKVNWSLGIEFYVNVCNVSSSRVSNVSRISNVLKEGVKLSSWIDYYAILKRLDVRVSKLGDPKPVEPLISYRIDLDEVLEGEWVILGMAATNRKIDYERITFMYTWSLEVKDVPEGLHSIPVNPEGYSSVRNAKKEGGGGGCVSGFMFATGCGALAALVMFFVWSYVVGQEKVEGGDDVRADGFKYEKIDVVEGKDSETAMK